MTAAIILAFALVVAGALYIRLRWRRSPHAYRAMIALAVGYFIAGALADGWILDLAFSRHAKTQSASANVTPAASTPPIAASEAANPLSKFSANVVGITDGDTLDARTPAGLTYAVRLEGIDAPERDQAFGSQSTANLTALASGKSVTLVCENEKSYGRLICKILLPNGEDVDLDQVKAGAAWHYK